MRSPLLPNAVLRALAALVASAPAAGQGPEAAFPLPNEAGDTTPVEATAPFVIPLHDRDGVADELARVASLDVQGSEPSGILFDPIDPHRLWITIMHPASTDDSLWVLDLRPYPGHQTPLLTTRAAIAAQQPAALPFGPGSFVLDADPGDLVTIAAESPSGAMLGAPFALAPLPAAQPFGGNATTLPIPSGLAGWSVMAQSVALQSGVLALGDAVELVLR